MMTKDAHVQLAVTLLIGAEMNLVHHGSLVPIFALVDSTGHVHIVAIAGCAPRELQGILQGGDWPAWVILTDTWLATMPPGTRREDLRGPVRDLPQREEAICLVGVHRPSAHTFQILQRYRRDQPATGRVIEPLGEIEVTIADDQVQMESWMLGRQHDA